MNVLCEHVFVFILNLSFSILLEFCVSICEKRWMITFSFYSLIHCVVVLSFFFFMSFFDFRLRRRDHAEKPLLSKYYFKLKRWSVKNNRMDLSSGLKLLILHWLWSDWWIAIGEWQKPKNQKQQINWICLILLGAFNWNAIRWNWIISLLFYFFVGDPFSPSILMPHLSLQMQTVRGSDDTQNSRPLKIYINFVFLFVLLRINLCETISHFM